MEGQVDRVFNLIYEVSSQSVGILTFHVVIHCLLLFSARNCNKMCVFMSRVSTVMVCIVPGPLLCVQSKECAPKRRKLREIGWNSWKIVTNLHAHTSTPSTRTTHVDDHAKNFEAWAIVQTF